MRYWLIVCGLVSTAFAYDPHISIFANSTPVSPVNPGVSLEFANTFGVRTVIGSDLGITEPNSDNQRSVLFGLNSRLLYSAGLTSQWYPQASVSWQSDLNQIDTWVGAGYQREIIPEAGYFVEANWRTQSDRFLFKIGIRVWLDRFSSLDTRVRSSEPLGVTYRAGQPIELSSSLALDQSEQSAPSGLSQSDPVNKSEVDTSQATVIVSTDEVEKVLPIAVIEQGDWFVHLGLFGQLESIEDLETDIRLAKYKQQMTTWYDPSRRLYRLLLGPYEKEQAQGMLAEIKRLKLDGFLYQKLQ